MPSSLNAMITVTANPPTKRQHQAPTLTSEQRKEKALASRQKANNIEADIDEWYRNAVHFSEVLSAKYGKKADYYLHAMFSGAANVHNSRKPNAYNAWGHKLAKEAREHEEHGGSVIDLLDAQKERLDEYHKLSAEDKEKLIEELTEERDIRRFGVRLCQRGCTNDLRSTCNKVESLLHDLKHRVSIEYMLCIVRNTDEYTMDPCWYFSNMAINEYLKGAVLRGWDVGKIGALMEAFAVAGCEHTRILQTAKAKADWYKAYIRDKINGMLVEITKNPKAAMNYLHFGRDIIIKYSIDLIGWTHDKFANPSDLSTSLPPLQKLKAVLDDGKCFFVKLTPGEREKREAAYLRAVEQGTVETRKQRSDAGKPRGKRKRQGQSEDEEPAAPNEDAPVPKKRRKQAPANQEVIVDVE
ncbi:hypothetical protein CERSUDRAFT_94550 [Gelatoporia subvermispora B]|uniref:Uncharacterized protein n=1 Tax=Ceriporiopsis subvermispora (strain B) TaxID=914234 RepID=M2QKK3_CERS8|nr:hypothetical protein CERSUDRAFT_94550 [Gelatoporia subvermispora B]